MVNEIYFLRHGIRLDVDDKKYFRHYLKRVHDVPLSARGLFQAEETAEFLIDKKIDYIFSSPFFRTLQTADTIAEKLKLNTNIEHGFIENLGFFDKYPEVLSKEEAVKVFPSVNLEYETLVTPTHPEKSYEVDVYNRAKKTIDKIIEKYDGTILVVGHWASVESAAKALVYPEPLVGFDVKMCALNKFVNEDGIWKFVFGSTDHLSEESLEN